jgi:hypothetical protein
VSYGKVKDTFWTDKKIRSLSDDAKMLALYLMTGPHRNILGCMRVPSGYITEDLGWASERLADAIAMLCQCRFICRDDDGWTIILNQLKHDPIKVPNHARAAIALANTVPHESIVYQELAPRLSSSLDAIKMASEWHPQAIVIPEPSPLPEPLPEPEPKGSAPDGAPPLPPDDDHFDLPAIVDRSEAGAAVRQWNATAEQFGLTQVQSLNDTRRKKLLARLKECGGLDGWTVALEKIAASSFLCGKNDRGWRADFDFVLRQSSFTKLMEGGYDNREVAARSSVASALDKLYAEAAEADAR